MKVLRKCLKCGKYTLKGECPGCGSKTVEPQPPRFSPEDKYVKYRLKWRLENEQHNDKGTG